MKLLVGILLMLSFATTPAGAPAAAPASAAAPLGIPCADKAWYARNVWAMVYFDERLFVGCGNSSNLSPSSNPGPIDVWTYQAGTGWHSEFVVDEEQIDRFVILDGKLSIPGHDAHEDSTFGNWYQRSADGTWVKYRNIPDALHVYDLAEYDGLLFAALGKEAKRPLAVAISGDGGETWTEQVVPSGARFGGPVCAAGGDPDAVARVYSFFTVGRNFYANTLPVINHDCLPNGGVTAYTRFVVSQWDGAGFEPVKVDLFNQLPADRVVYPTVFGTQTVIIAAQTVNDHQWTPVGVFALDDSLEAQAINPPDCARPQALSLYDEALYVLCNQPTDAGWQVSVAASCDLTAWQPVMNTVKPTFARSFALAPETIYFSLGADTDASKTVRNDVGDVFASPDFVPIACGRSN